MYAWWRGLRRSHRILIGVIAIALALMALLKVDVRRVGDPGLCGECIDCEESLSTSPDE